MLRLINRVYYVDFWTCQIKVFLYTSTIISLIQTLVHCSASKSIILNVMKFNKYLEENADFGLK